MTRTFTCYFSEEQLVELREIVAQLKEDANGRFPFLGEEARRAMSFRLTALEAAIELLGERAYY